MISAYVTRGWSVIPLFSVDPAGRCSCRLGDECPEKNRGKHPLYKNWQKVENSLEALASALRYRPGLNVGLATGRRSGFWALDIDSPAALQALLDEYGALPGPLQRTGSGGLHVAFEMPADFEPTNSPGRLPKGIDVRGTGGQIVAAPSVSGRGAYQLLDSALTVHPNVPWLLELIRPPAYEPREAAERIDTTADTPDARRAAAYGRRAVELATADLAAEQHTRNAVAFTTAARLHEIINAGWVGYEAAEDAYLTAAARASGNKLEPFSEREARQVWTNAAHKVGDAEALLPASTIGGERLDFSGVLAPGPAVAISSSAPAAGSSLEDMMQAGVSLSGSAPRPDPAGLNLPPEFWDARPVLKHIRDAAHARLVSADVAFYTVLARLSALWPHQVRLDSGVRSPAAANVFVAVVGPSGAGKTSGVGVADDLLARPPWLDAAGFADGLPLGTGEGIAESYMGSKAVPKLDTNGQKVLDKDNAVKSTPVRAQVRHNAFFYADEGEALAKLVERNGSTVGETLRRAWVGGTIGQANGRTETTRIIEKGQYSLGMIIGFQLDTSQHLLADVGPGTPQRFLWAWALDPSIPDARVSHPGPLLDVWPPAAPTRPAEGWSDFMNPATDVDLRRVTFPAEVLAELWTEARMTGRGELILPDYDAHRPLHLVKVATLLAQLEGRRDVNSEDWTLAKLVWKSSCSVRDYLLAHGGSTRKKARETQRGLQSEDAADAERARLGVIDTDRGEQVHRVAVQLARRLRDGNEALTRSQTTQLIAGRDRKLYAADAIEHAVAQQWLIVIDPGYGPGPVQL